MSAITGNVISLHVSPGRSDVVALIVHSAQHRGEFHCPTTAVTLDDRPVKRHGEVADFIVTRTFTAVVAKGVPDGDAELGVYRAESMALVTVEQPVQ